MIAEWSEPVDALGTGDGDTDRYRGVGEIPDPRGVDLEELAVEVDQVAAVQGADDLDGLGEHVLTVDDRRPSLADDVFVEILTGTQAESEATVGEDLQCRGLLRDDRRVIPDRGTRHVGHQLHAFGGLRYRAQYGPGVGRVTLGRQPGEIVVAGHLEIEPGGLGADRVAHEFLGPGLLGHQGVAESNSHSRSVRRV
ncbi:Uncharacterised protein [Gordonia bronchialis]|nr:Uncharacterised protein [Gordonia bronchialis]